MRKAHTWPLLCHYLSATITATVAITIVTMTTTTAASRRRGCTHPIHVGVSLMCHYYQRLLLTQKRYKEVKELKKSRRGRRIKKKGRNSEREEKKNNKKRRTQEEDFKAETQDSLHARRLRTSKSGPRCVRAESKS
ncbi:hypothetical protein DBV15_03443 [Temnothorax longispinosus]|uniref:Uncharacterized protein n=1 Tax=Temnothorax longispinosus TaxID=300112 RepID=A0A4S2KIV5_9HYME|nr:hypothetical protein DBV15_03443 [Temnothorax longispinosus]